MEVETSHPYEARVNRSSNVCTVEKANEPKSCTKERETKCIDFAIIWL